MKTKSLADQLQWLIIIIQCANARGRQPTQLQSLIRGVKSSHYQLPLISKWSNKYHESFHLLTCKASLFADCKKTILKATSVDLLASMDSWAEDNVIKHWKKTMVGQLQTGLLRCAPREPLDMIEMPCFFPQSAVTGPCSLPWASVAVKTAMLKISQSNDPS